MPHFQYQARNPAGTLISGRLEAASPQAVISWMATQQLAPIKVEEQVNGLSTSPNWLLALQGQHKPTEQDIELLSGQLGSLLRAGIPLINAVNGLRSNQKNPAMGKVLDDIHAALDKGNELSAAMARHLAVFGDYFVNMVRVGESAGRLDEVFQRLHEQLVFNRRMKQKTASVMRYPMFVLSAMAAALSVVMGFVVPAFTGIYRTMQMNLPLPTRMLIASSDFARQQWPWLLAGAALAAYAAYKHLQTRPGRLLWDKLKLRMPVIGITLKKATTARFCQAFALALHNGVPVLNALTLVSRVADNAYFESRILDMRDRLTKGDSLLRAFQTSGLFTPTELQMIAVGEQTGDVETMVSQLASLYQEEVEYETNRLAQVIEPILLVFMGGLMLILMLGIFMPMWNMTQMLHR